MVLIYKDHLLVCIVSKKALRRIMDQIEQNGFNDTTRKLFNTLNIDLFRILFEKEARLYPQWYNFGQMDMLDNLVAIEILKLFNEAMTTGSVRYSE